MIFENNFPWNKLIWTNRFNGILFLKSMHLYISGCPLLFWRAKEPTARNNSRIKISEGRMSPGRWLWLAEQKPCQNRRLLLYEIKVTFNVGFRSSRTLIHTTKTLWQWNVYCLLSIDKTRAYERPRPTGQGQWKFWWACRFWNTTARFASTFFKLS